MRFNREKAKFNREEYNFDGINRGFILARLYHNQIGKSRFNLVNICQG